MTEAFFRKVETGFRPENATTKDAYAEVAATTNFSFLRGASHPAEMVTVAAVRSLRAIPSCTRCMVTMLETEYIRAASIKRPLATKLMIIF